MTVHLLRVLLVALALCPLSRVASAQATVEAGFMLPVSINGATIRLDAYSVRPAGDERSLPLVILTHGTDLKMEDNKALRATNHRTIARDFARRGWHAVAVVRQGFGLSEGNFPRAGNCGTTHRIDRVFATYADDLVAAAEALSKVPKVDASRVLFIGTSTGGLSSLVAASRFAGGKAYAVNLSGGWRSTHCEWEGQVAGIFAEAGKASAARGSVPSIWFYAENDSFFGPPVVEKFLDSYRRAGGNARFVGYPSIGDDGHYLFGTWRGREKWLPELDQFLAANGLPHLTAVAIRQAMDRAKVPAGLRGAVERYLRLPGEKVLAITGDNARVYWNFGNGQTDNARARALEDCGKVSPGCRVLMVNNGLPTEP